MRVFQGRISAIRRTASGQAAAEIACPPAAIPAAGRYVLGFAPEAEPAAPLASALFNAGRTPGGFLAAAPLPVGWAPGMALTLRGPLGRGFQVPERARRVALVGLDGSLDRLLPLLQEAGGREVAVFSDAPLPRLPASVEAHPLSVLPEALAWPDYLACDLPAALLPELPALAGLPPGGHFPCPAQALVSLPMPCGALADCGACAISGRRGWKLVCRDGPVFDAGNLW